MRSALFRLRVGNQKKAIDLTLLSVYFSIAWYLAKKCKKTEEIQEVFLRPIKKFKDEIESNGPLSSDVYDLCYDALLLLEEILKQTKRGELLEANKMLKPQELCLQWMNL